MNDAFIIDRTNLTKVTSNGNIVWTKNLGFTSKGLTIDSGDNIFITGIKESTSNVVVMKLNNAEVRIQMITK